MLASTMSIDDAIAQRSQSLTDADPELLAAGGDVMANLSARSEMAEVEIPTPQARFAS